MTQRAPFTWFHFILAVLAHLLLSTARENGVRQWNVGGAVASSRCARGMHVMQLCQAIVIVLLAACGPSAYAEIMDLEKNYVALPDRPVLRAPARFAKGWDFYNSEGPVILKPAQALPQSFTLEVWVRVDDPAGDSTVFSSHAWRRFLLTLSDASRVSLSFLNQTDEPSVVTYDFGYEFVIGRWYQITITSDVSHGMLVYINGKPVYHLAASPESLPSPQSDLSVVGAYSFNGEGVFENRFKGAIDRPILLDHALPEHSVLERYQEANRTVPVVPLPVQVWFVNDRPISATGVSTKISRSTELLSADDVGMVKLAEAVDAHPIGGQIVLSDSHSNQLPNHIRDLVEDSLPAEGYVLSIRPERIDIVADDARGLFYGINTLTQLLAKSPLQQVDIYDYPEFRYRAGLYVSNSEPPSGLNNKYSGDMTLRGTIQDFSNMRCNAIMLRLHDFAAMDDPKVAESVMSIVEYARQYHLEVIPYLQCYGHSKGILWKDILAGHTKTIGDEAVVLIGDKPCSLQHNNVIITDNTPILVRSENGTLLVEGEDYEIIPGQLLVDWNFPADLHVKNPWTRPYIREDNKPFAIRRLPNGAIPSGEMIRVTYDVATGGPGYCPYSPSTRAQVERAIALMIKMIDPEYINLAMDEVWEPWSPQGRCCGDVGLSRAERFKDEVNRTLAFAKTINPDIKLMYYSDMLDANQTQVGHTTWPDIDVQASELDIRAVMMPWYYREDMADRWRIRQSVEKYLDLGHPVIGTASHYPLNQFSWGQYLMTIHRRMAVDGFTLTTWAHRRPASMGYAAYAQNAWSPARMPFDKLVELRIELNGLAATAETSELEFRLSNNRIPEYQLDRLRSLLVAAQLELDTTDQRALSELDMTGLPELLDAVTYAKQLLE
ncbi:MAG: hypothetical protein IT445_18750 [Phycisphaeraceae bacterium]|nr:hypothetical protein [Phycisphaeraceae bacterium]